MSQNLGGSRHIRQSSSEKSRPVNPKAEKLAKEGKNAFK